MRREMKLKDYWSEEKIKRVIEGQKKLKSAIKLKKYIRGEIKKNK